MRIYRRCRCGRPVGRSLSVRTPRGDVDDAGTLEGARASSASSGGQVTVRRRLDVELVRRGLVNSSGDAIDAIDAGRVTVGGAPASSPARLVDAGEAVAVADEPGAYVSRGGHKLAAALDAFEIDVTGRSAIDAGASTGGFTDCLLKRGAAHVVAVDVGRGQLHWSLQTDARITVLDRTNVRDLTSDDVGVPPEVCVVDLAFISLRTAAPALLAVAAPGADFVMLVKPQFEAGRERVGEGGVVRDPQVHRQVLNEVIAGLSASGIGVIGLVASPLRGAAGNVEFLAHARRGAARVVAADVDAVVAAAHGVVAR